MLSLRWKMPYVIMALTCLMAYTLVELWLKGSLPALSVHADWVGFLLLATGAILITICMVRILACLLQSSSMVPVVIPLMVGIALVVVASGMPFAMGRLPLAGSASRGLASLTANDQNDLQLNVFHNGASGRTAFIRVNLQSEFARFIRRHTFAPLISKNSRAAAQAACSAQGGDELIRLMDSYYVCVP